MNRINTFEPYRDSREIEAVRRVIKSGWWKEGVECEKLEREFSTYTKSPYAISVNSATSGLDLIFKAYGITGGEVIVPAMTFIATGLVPLWNNCKVVFADVEPNHLTIDPKDVDRKLTTNTKAIIVQHMSGHPVDLDAFVNYKNLDIVVIEDAAHGCGSYYKGHHVGIQFPSAFSFNVVKQIAAGEGGIVTTPDAEIAEKMKRLRWFGIDESTWQKEGKKYKWDYSINEVGYKYHFNDILASLARVQLERLSETNRIRYFIANTYTERLFDLPITLPYAENNVIHSWHQYIIRVCDCDRDNLIDFMAEKGIACGVHYKPINMYPLWEHGDTPVTDYEWKRMVTLPMHARLKPEDIDYICNSIREFYESKKG